MDEFKIDKRTIVGERNNTSFWIQPTSNYNPDDWDSVLRTLNYAHGNYKLQNDNLIFNLTVEMSNRNGIFFFIVISAVLDYFIMTKTEYFNEFPTMTIFAIGYLLFQLWRVREDRGFYKELLTNELEQHGL